MKVYAGYEHLAKFPGCGESTEVALPGKRIVGCRPVPCTLHIQQAISQCPGTKGLELPGQAEGLLRDTEHLRVDAEHME